MAIELQCAVREFRDRRWLLDLSGPAAVMSTPDGKPVCKFSREEALQRWLCPKFGSNVKHFTIQLEEQAVPFKVSRDGLKQIKAFLTQSFAEQGPEAIDQFRSRGARNILIGLGCIALGGGGTIVSYMAAASNPEGGTYFIYHGAVIYGIFSLCCGFSQMSQATKMDQMSQDA